MDAGSYIQLFIYKKFLIYYQQFLGYLQKKFKILYFWVQILKSLLEKNGGTPTHLELF